IAMRSYRYILSAYGGENLAPAETEIRHMKRWFHQNHLWDLELQIQGALETELQFAFPTDVRETTNDAQGESDQDQQRGSTHMPGHGTPVYEGTTSPVQWNRTSSRKPF